MITKKNYICISCPVGCHLELETEGDIIIKISGNKCPRGEVYANEEFTSPKRVVTATCPSDSAKFKRVPVKTDRPISKELIDSLLEKIYLSTVKAPANSGSVIIANFRGTGVNVVTTRALKC